MTMPRIESQVADAVGGDVQALERVLRHIKDDVYGLAIRMLWHPEDAEDATQEVLVRVATNLSKFEGRASFRTWVYRVAVRALLNFKRARVEVDQISFDEFGQDLQTGLGAAATETDSTAERELLKREVKIGCTQAMLLCLDREHRIAYLLGEILDLSGAEAAECMEVTPAAYRKRLSRARGEVNRFTAAQCGLVNEAAPCRCGKRVDVAIRQGRIDAGNLLFAAHPVADASESEVEAVVSVVSAICDGRTLMRSNPRYAAPTRLVDWIRELSRGESA